MKVIDHILQTKSPRFSYEIVPPPRGRSVRDVIEVVEILQPLNPPWIDVTSHASSAIFREHEDGSIQKQTYKKRPGSLGICGIIQNRFRIDTVAHVLCQGFTREETEDALIELSYLGIDNIIALKGDSPNYNKTINRTRTVNNYASDLVEQVVGLRRGRFLQDIAECAPLDFGVGVAGYPEKHFEAANLKTDLQWLKYKVDAGADYIVTQMFFDNAVFFRFVEACREIGIKVPIIPGLKVLRSENQLKSIPKTFHVDLPEPLVDEIHASPKHAGEIGLNWSQKQVEELLQKGFNNIHYYVLNDAPLVDKVVRHFQ